MNPPPFATEHVVLKNNRLHVYTAPASKREQTEGRLRNSTAKHENRAERASVRAALRWGMSPA